MEDNAGTNMSSSSEVFWMTHRHEIKKGITSYSPRHLRGRLDFEPVRRTPPRNTYCNKNAATADRIREALAKGQRRGSKSCSDGSQRTDASEASTSTRSMLATLSLATLSLLTHSHPHPTPATTRLTAYQRMPPPMAMPPAPLAPPRLPIGRVDSFMLRVMKNPKGTSHTMRL